MKQDFRAIGHRRQADIEGWLSGQTEAAIEPELPIIDPHHHLWERVGDRYGFAEMMRDATCGHDIRATVFVECGTVYRSDGPPELRCVGETEYVNGAAAIAASGVYGPTRLCAGIVGYADLRLGERVEAVLQAQIAAGGGRFRGIRNTSHWDASGIGSVTGRVRPEGLLRDPALRAGFARLAKLGLTFDAFLFHPQLGDVIDLARTFPETTIILDHVGGPLGVGPYADRRDEIFPSWRASMSAVAAMPNVVVKLGGLGMPTCGFGFDRADQPPTSDVLAQAWAPYITASIEAFGPDRCMFESNFPVDKQSCGYGVLWNAFKRIVAAYSTYEKAALFAGTAARVYRLDL